MLLSGAWGKVIHEKNLKQKSHDTVPLKGHGNEPVFPMFLHLHFEPFRFWLRIRIRKTTPRIGESGSRPDCL